MIRKLNSTYILDTNHTTYCFRVLDTGHLEHLYYGKKIRIDEEADTEHLMEKHSFAPGNTIIYDAKHPKLALEDLCLEASFYGKGDIREAMAEMILPDGSFTLDFLYLEDQILEGKRPLVTLPSAYSTEENVSELVIILKEARWNLRYELHFGVFEQEDVITRWVKVENLEEIPVVLTKVMSFQLDLFAGDYDLHTFTGAWAREMHRTSLPVSSGRHVISSVAGTSSSRANPFFMLSEKCATQDHGQVFGFNLIYSGNHYESVDVSGYGKIRILSGINPTQFAWELKSGETFETPEAVMTVSCDGFNGMSRNMHRFVRECIVRGSWKKKERPILINSWEAAYFNINEGKLLALAKTAKEAGIELFVMDDGWFQNRKDDQHALGDWTPDMKKLPNGVAGLAEKINRLGLDFGIWIEPEMINRKSELFSKHPDWTLAIPGRKHSEGRTQRILDLTRDEVVDYLTETLTDLLNSANIAYVKWDMNRIFSDVYSRVAEPEAQGEIFHRYYLGFYRLCRTLTERFPDILFEGCSAGGNRFDLGILCYFPQIWTSDNTDALSRLYIQEGTSYGYPLSVISNHVSDCPNHQTLRTSPLYSRFAVAAFGILGYECNIQDLTKEEFHEVKEQVEIYKKYRRTMQFGTFYRGRSGNHHEWTCVSEDGSEAVGMLFQELVSANTPAAWYFPKGLNPEVRYHFENRKLTHNIMEFGGLINTASPVHVRQNSLLHKALAQVVKMPDAVEDYAAFGDSLMYGGVKLSSAFAATGYDEETRFFQDFAAGLYFMKQLDET